MRPGGRKKPPLALLVILAALLPGCGAEDDGLSTTRPDPLAALSGLPIPEIEGPITGGLRGKPWAGALEPQSQLDKFNYIQEEFFYSGTARQRDVQGDLRGGEVEYTTRMLVIRPERAEDFNGVVLMEWFNVTAEMDLPLMWILGHDELTRGGYAYVGVSAQPVGVQTSPLALKFWDPLRYAPLSHPGDAYSFDIFAQAARALMTRDDPLPLGGLHAQKIIASGESQSCSFLAQYANRVHITEPVLDGFLLHSCASDIREDINVPVMLFANESEIDGFTAADGSAQEDLEVIADVPGLGLLRLQMINNGFIPDADGDNFRIWEIAGGSHYDKQAMEYLVPLLVENLLAPIDTAFVPPLEWNLACATLPNRLAMERPTRAMIHQLTQWIQTGSAPPMYPRLLKHEDGSIQRDAAGLALGGIRMPTMVAPEGVNIGDDCPFIGSFTAFSAAEMQARYGDISAYIDEVSQAAQLNVDEGTLLPEDALEYVREAELVGF